MSNDEFASILRRSSEAFTAVETARRERHIAIKWHDEIIRELEQTALNRMRELREASAIRDGRTTTQIDRHQPEETSPTTTPQGETAT